ncbi:MAG: hypothetical protein HY855_17740 [Burkholderiales bacterium]|nr:hypothetical protein [Burkholderiales bacterium]
MASALEATYGNPTAAARILKCHPNTVRGYIARHERCKHAAEESRETRLDVAEFELDKLVLAGDARAIIFLLTRLGRHRGYTKTLGTCECCGRLKVPSAATPPRLHDAATDPYPLRGKSYEELQAMLPRLLEPEPANADPITADAV